MASHEFRTPLSLIMGNIELLQREINDTRIKRRLNYVQANTEQLRSLVDQLLEFIRLEKIEVSDIEVIDISQVIQSTTNNMDALFEKNSLRFSMNISSEAWIAVPNEVAETIISNLLSNAIKYTPQGGTIELAVKKEEAIIIEVKDSGIGIAPSDHKKVFERFTRVQSEYSQHIPGEGLGLALVKELTENFNGTIQLNSEINMGSTFTLRFPQADSDTQQLKQYRNLGAIDSAMDSAMVLTNTFSERPLVKYSEDRVKRVYSIKSLPHPLEKSKPVEENATILIVDDNQAMRDFIGDCLRPGYRCLLAANGKEGIQLALQEQPDLVITDLMMADHSGFELGQLLRDNPKTVHIPLILITAKSDIESRELAWRLKFDAFLGKPFSVTELELRCESLLAVRRILQTSPVENDIRSNGSLSPRNGDGCAEAEKVFLQKLEQFMEANYSGNRIGAKSISAFLHVSEKQLQRKIKALTGETIPSYIRNFRLQRGAERLLAGKDITTVALEVGFSSQSHFSAAFSKHYGCTPTVYKKSAGQHNSRSTQSQTPNNSPIMDSP